PDAEGPPHRCPGPRVLGVQFPAVRPLGLHQGAAQAGAREAPQAPRLLPPERPAGRTGEIAGPQVLGITIVASCGPRPAVTPGAPGECFVRGRGVFSPPPRGILSPAARGRAAAEGTAAVTGTHGAPPAGPEAACAAAVCRTACPRDPRRSGPSHPAHVGEATT